MQNMSMDFSIIDIGLVIILGFFAIRAVLRGLLRELMGLLGVIIALLVSSLTYQTLADFLRRVSNLPDFWWEAVSFVAILVIVFAVLIEVGQWLSRLIQATPFSLMDRILGGVLGFAKGVLLSYILLCLLILIIPKESLQTPDSSLSRGVAESRLTPAILTAGDQIMQFVPESLTKSFRDKTDLLDSLHFRPLHPPTR